jgi:hypothetical protein
MTEEKQHGETDRAFELAIEGKREQTRGRVKTEEPNGSIPGIHV